MKFNLWPAVLASSATLAALFMAIGLAWVVIFRTTRVLNFANGQYAIFGAYLVYAMSTGGLNWWLSAGIGLLLSAALGAVTYFGLLRPLAGRPQWTPVILTMGIAFVLDSVMSMIWGARTIFVASPVGSHTFELGGGAILNSKDVLVIGAAALSFCAVLAFLRLSRIGTQMRAAAETPLLASQSGINIDIMFALGWAISSAVVAIGGISYSLTTVLEPGAVSVGILGLTPALLGGLDSIEGVVVGSVVAAVASNFTVLYLGSPALNAVAAVILLVILVLRPFGLFGTPAIERV